MDEGDDQLTGRPPDRALTLTRGIADRHSARHHTFGFIAGTVTAAAGTTRKTIAQGTAYQQYTLCLSPQAVGRPQAVTFSNPVIQSGVVCGSANTETLQIDDLAAGNDASCPSM